MDPLLTRRQTLQSLAFSAVFGGSLFGLIGCGGGGHGGGGTKTVTSSTAVELPTGLALPTTELVAGTAYGTSSLSGNGFNAKISSNGPTFAYVQHRPSGKFVLFGLVGKGRPGVTPLASAALMVALATGLVGLPTKNLVEGLALLEADAGIGSLADTIASTMASDPYCLTNNNAAVAASLKAAVQGLGGSRATPRLASRADDAPLLQVSPSDQQGGARVDHGDENAVVPTNLKRRPIAAYTYLVGHEPGDGVGSSAAATSVDVQELEATTGLVGSLVTLGGEAAFAEKAGKPVTLAISGSDDKTFYETVVLMASGSQDEPAFFSSPRYAAEVAGWRTKRGEMNVHAWVGGILLDLFKTIAGGAVAVVSAGRALDIVAQMDAIVAGAEESVLALAKAGRFGEVTASVLSRMTSSEILGVGTRRVVLQVLGVGAEAAEAAAAGVQGLALQGIAALALSALAATGGLVVGTDAAVTYFDVLLSPQAALWTETVLKPSVKIAPHTGEVRQNASIGLSATLVGLPGMSATYTWTLTGSSFGTLTGAGGDGGSGKTITTTGTSVTFATTPSDPEGQVATITVEAKDKATGKSLGSDAAKIKVVANAPVTESGTFSVQNFSGPDNHQSTAIVSFAEVKGATSYSVRGTGGYDPYYYKNEVNVSYDPKNPPIGADGKPLLFAAGLSGIGGGGSEIPPENIAYLTDRFSAFTFTVTATFS